MYPKLKQKSKIKIQPDEINLFYNFNNMISKTAINDSAYQIIKICNGENSVDDIKKALEILYDEKKEIIDKFVDEFLEQSLFYGTIELSENRTERIEFTTIGSYEYWTPELIIIELTHNCLLNCIHCYANAGKQHESDMNIEKLEEIIDEVIALGIEKVQLTGGEPLIYKYISKVIKKLTDAGMYVNIVTSGMFEQKDLELLKLLKNNRGSVQVSLDGLEKTHNRYRNNNNSFNKAVKVIEYLIDNDVNVTVATTYIDQDIEEIKELCDFLINIKVQFYRIGMVINQGRAVKNTLDSSKNAFGRYESIVDLLTTEYNSNDFRIITEEFMHSRDQKNTNNCGAGYKILKIDPDFNIYPCLMINYVMGNLLDSKLKDFLSIENSLFPNMISPSIEYCFNCENNRLCNKCIAQGIIQSKSIDDCYWLEKNTIKNNKVANLIND